MLTETQHRVFQYLAKYPDHLVKDLHAATGISPTEALIAVRELSDMGYLARDKVNNRWVALGSEREAELWAAKL